MVSGFIDYEVESPLSEAALDDIEALLRADLRNRNRRRSKKLEDRLSNLREQLRELARSLVERRAMRRPVFRVVCKILDRLLRHAAGHKVATFLALERHLASCSEETHPSEAYVYDLIRYELSVRAAPEWRARIEAGGIDLSQLCSPLAEVRRRLAAAYAGRKGGTRQHELGWVLDRLATIYHEAGGEVTVSSHISPRAGPNEAGWVSATDFTRFVENFVAKLPGDGTRSGVNVGNLAKRLFPHFSINSRR